MLEYFCAENCRLCRELLVWCKDGPYTVCADCWDFPRPPLRTELDRGLVVHSAVEYEEHGISKLIRELKYRRDELIAYDFANLIEPLFWRCLDDFSKAPYVVPVPLHWTRLWSRGFNQAAQIAELMCDKVGAPFAPELLVRRKLTRAHHGLTKTERAENVGDAFGARRAKDPRDCIILVDDVLTSGATLSACAKVLREAGFARVVGLTVAQAPLQFVADDGPTL
jgi:ComF family protein